MIGGNVDGIFQVKTTTKNVIGEDEETWADVQSVHGWLDLTSGDSKYTPYYAKIQESTHVFVADYITLDSSITSEDSRMVIDGRIYDVKYIDDSMGMHKQLEVYLAYTGGDNHVCRV